MIAPLPKGVTGFSDRGVPAIPLIEKREIVTACHSAARRIGAAVIAIPAGPVTRCRNFSLLTFVKADRRVSVLLNDHAPLAGLATLEEKACLRGFMKVRQFVDDADLSAVLDPLAYACGWRLLSKAELDQAIEPGMLIELGQSERSQIHYWKPASIGDVIFNLWD